MYTIILNVNSTAIIKCERGNEVLFEGNLHIDNDNADTIIATLTAQGIIFAEGEEVSITTE